MSEEKANAILEYIKGLTSWWLTTVKQNDDSFSIQTGAFDGEDNVKAKTNALKELTCWWF